MDRRTLVRIASGIGLGLLAGCLGAGDEPSRGDTDEAATVADGGDETDTERDEADGADTGPDVVRDDEAELEFDTIESPPIERIAATDIDETEPDDSDAIHRLRVENESNDDRELAIRIEHDDETVLDGTNDLPAGTALDIAVSEPGTYEATIVSAGLENTTSVTRSDRSCDESRTVVSFTRGGGISTRTTTSC